MLWQEKENINKKEIAPVPPEFSTVLTISENWQSLNISTWELYVYYFM